ncbi:LysR family transcriptional regulator [Cupriavidus pinatubonensis]|uniref:LysR family transcriptional regulator n=1 Tax=Cupriavidus pinatubonensis TaxID=248026 RepID=UPI003618E1BD
MQALIAVADAGSIRAASRLEGLSQAAVTKALRELEQEVRLPLLLRTASGVALTNAGLRLLGHARLVVGQLARANDDLAVMRGERVGMLSISVTPWVMLTFLPRVMQEFRRRMPEVQLEVFEGLTAVALPRLREGTLDFAIGPFTAAMSTHEFECEPLLAYSSCVIARKGHACERVDSLHELLEEDWAVNYSAASYDAFMQNLFWQHGASIEPNRLLRTHSIALLFELIRHVGMISYCPEPLLVCESMRGWVQRFDLAEQFETSKLSIIGRRNAMRTHAAQVFVDCLLQEVRRRSRSAARLDAELFELLQVLF